MKPAKHLIAPLLILLLLLPAGPALSRDGLGPLGLLILTAKHKSSPDAGEPDETVAPQNIADQPPPDVVVLDDIYKKRPDGHSGTASPDALHKLLSSRSAVVMDAKTGEILYAKSPEKPGQPASTIKVLTSLLAIEHLNTTDLVPVSRRAANMPRSKVYLRPTKSYRANDLINAVLLASANDASVALAEKVAGSEKAFAEMMTRRARELGATNTVCKTASGLTAKGQQTTAIDLAIIFNKAMERPEFASRLKKRQTGTAYGKTLRSHNKALWQIAGAEGGKTGYTSAARQTYVGKFKRDERELLVAILGSRNMWRDISRLVEYGFASSQSTESVAVRTETQPAMKVADQPTIQVLSDQKKLASL